MVAVAASPTPGAAGSPFTARSHDHPPYKDMILSAIEALKDSKGSSRHAISKYIADNYSDLPPSHSSLLANHLRRLHSKGILKMFKQSYKLADPLASRSSDADTGSKKRGRPPKNAKDLSPLLESKPKRRGRPTKLAEGSFSTKKTRTARLPKRPSPSVMDTASVYILPQAEQLKSGFLQSLPGAVAIVLPEGLLNKKTAKSPVLILPNGVQTLVDVSAGVKKQGRPRKFEGEKGINRPKAVKKKRHALPRRKALRPKQVPVHNEDTNADHGSLFAKKRGRPRKLWGSTPIENGHLEASNAEPVAPTEADTGILEAPGKVATFDNVEGMQSIPVPETAKKLFGRSKKTAPGKVATEADTGILEAPGKVATVDNVEGMQSIPVPESAKKLFGRSKKTAVHGSPISPRSPSVPLRI